MQSCCLCATQPNACLRFDLNNLKYSDELLYKSDAYMSTKAPQEGKSVALIKINIKFFI